MTQAIKAVTTTCWQHVRMPPGPRCASAVGKWREWWRGSLGPCRRQHMPQPVRSITLPLIVPACEAETISHCYSLWWGHKSNNKRKKKNPKNRCEVLGIWAGFVSAASSFHVCCEFKKAKVLLTPALSRAWIQEYIFSYTVRGSMKVIAWERGFVSADNRRVCAE